MEKERKKKKIEHQTRKSIRVLKVPERAEETGEEASGRIISEKFPRTDGGEFLG